MPSLPKEGIALNADKNIDLSALSEEENMHIVLVTPFFVNTKHEPLTGMLRYVYKIAAFLGEMGHNVEIVAGALNNRIWIYENIKVYNAQWTGDLKGSALAISVAVIRRERALQKRLKQINAENAIDIVQYAGWSGTGCMHGLKCPAVLRLSTYSRVQYAQSETMQDYITIYSFWERLAGLKADGIIAPSKIIGEQFGKDVKKRVTIMETPYNEQIAEEQSVYDNVLKNKKYLLFYGSFTSDKGFQVIGDMLPKLFAENEELLFVCAGWNIKTKHGNAVHDVRRKLGRNQDRMIYLGILSQCQLYPVIRHAEAVLIPSLVDNLPNACLEALSLDKIVIGTYGTSLEQMIDDGKNGFLTEQGNAEGLLGAVNKVLHMSEQEKRDMIVLNRQLLKKYAPDRAVKKLERYYRWLIENRN